MLIRNTPPAASLAILSALAMVSCGAPPDRAPDPSPIAQAAGTDALGEQLRDAIQGIPVGVAAARSSTTPPDAFVVELDRIDRCTLRPGPSIPAGKNVHPSGFGTDGDVTLSDDGEWFRIVFNHPVWVSNLPKPGGTVRRGRWPTSIWAASARVADHGTLWTEPTPVLLPRTSPIHVQPLQWETPSRWYDRLHQLWRLAVLGYQYDVAGHRVDRIYSFRARRPGPDGRDGAYDQVGEPMSPVGADEQPFTNPDGFRLGGVQEPSEQRFGNLIARWYNKMRYAAGLKPSIGLAISTDNGDTWTRWPRPVQRPTHPGAEHAGQPNVVRLPSGRGLSMMWQEVWRAGGVKHHGFFQAWSPDGVNWVPNPRNPVLEQSATGWDRGRITAPSQCFVPDGDGGHWLYLFYFGAAKPAGSGEPFWFGVARTRMAAR